MGAAYTWDWGEGAAVSVVFTGCPCPRRSHTRDLLLKPRLGSTQSLGGEKQGTLTGTAHLLIGLLGSSEDFKASKYCLSIIISWGR